MYKALTFNHIFAFVRIGSWLRQHPTEQGPRPHCRNAAVPLAKLSTLNFAILIEIILYFVHMMTLSTQSRESSLSCEDNWQHYFIFFP